MRKFILSLLCCITFCVTTVAKADDAVSMVSYEQRWLDSNGTIALKNNTNEEIKNVSFVIKYLDMSGNPLDYEEFSYNIDIAPGMTKKLDIPAYEHERNYHYYKTKDNSGHPAFKIEYEFKGYNLAAEEDEEEIDEDFSVPKSLYSTSTIIFAIVFIIALIGLSVGLYVLVAVMANNRNRSVVLWLLLSFIASPILIIIILLCIGESRDDKY